MMIINSLLYIHVENEDALKMLKFVIYGDTVKNLIKHSLVNMLLFAVMT